MLTVTTIMAIAICYRPLRLNKERVKEAFNKLKNYLRPFLNFTIIYYIMLSPSSRTSCSSLVNFLSQIRNPNRILIEGISYSYFIRDHSNFP